MNSVPTTIGGPRAGRPARPELLAPAGDWECARAAVENGADAIYFGLEQFNARMRAHNFTEADLPKLMAFLHHRGVKGYVTFNTLVFQDEMARAERYARTIIAAGVDAAIVQDVGICRLLRRLSPDFPIHASTQMTVTSRAGIEFARELGCQLVVLARECSLQDLEAFQAAPGDSAMPLEVFVHGALCVAYSGQCLTSESLGGRSANRGECAQACRLPYELIADEQPVPLGDRRYLLSPQDLAGIEMLPELARLGVASLKIEGRLKSPEYVASITRLYRAALDQAVPAAGEARYEMEMAFSRGLHTGWFRGNNHQELVHGRFGKKRGVFLGTIREVTREGVVLAREGPLKPGDGVVFDCGRPEQREEGGRVYEIRAWRRGGASGNAPLVWLGFGRGNLDFQRVHPGDKLWKTSDPELERRLRQTFTADRPRYRRPVDLEIHGAAGGPLTVLARDDTGSVAQAQSRLPLAAAETQPLTTGLLRAQFSRLGGTPFQLGELANHLRGAVLLPVSELNRLRREIVETLSSLRARPRRWTLAGPEAGPAAPAPPPAPGAAADVELLALARTLPQLETILESRPATVYCELEDPKKFRDAVRLARAAGTAIFAAPPRIFKTGEDWILNQVRSSEPDGILARNYDHLRAFAGLRLRGDYSLNIANRESARYFLERFALERVTASYDLNLAQLDALLAACPADWFEITLHQHMPMFHMEHCVFCAFLSTGKDYRDCGRPCDRVDLKLRDRVGALHPVKADAGCRNTVFNAAAQTGAEYFPALRQRGARRFRLEFLNETPALVRQTLDHYSRLLAGKITGAQLWRELKLFNQLGVTRGQLASRNR